MKPVNVNKENFKSEVLEAQGKVLVDFWAPWCGPCRMVLPLMDEIAAERPDIKVCKINVDEESELASQFRVMTIPTLMVMEGGRVISQASGARPKAGILSML